FEEWCISEKCLALEDAWESCNSLNGILHDFFRGLCLPECYYVELSGYCGCFDEAWDVAELLYDVLAGVVLTCQYGDAEGHLALELLGRLHTVEAGVSVGCAYVADLAEFFDCRVDVLWGVRGQAKNEGVCACGRCVDVGLAVARCLPDHFLRCAPLGGRD